MSEEITTMTHMDYLRFLKDTANKTHDLADTSVRIIIDSRGFYSFEMMSRTKDGSVSAHSMTGIL